MQEDWQVHLRRMTAYMYLEAMVIMGMSAKLKEEHLIAKLILRWSKLLGLNMWKALIS